jgi:hypothetical protein
MIGRWLLKLAVTPKNSKGLGLASAAAQRHCGKMPSSETVLLVHCHDIVTQLQLNHLVDLYIVFVLWLHSQECHCENGAASKKKFGGENGEKR